MAKYISELEVSLSQEDEALFREKNFTKINIDVFQGNKDQKAYIWFKKGTEGITRIQLTHKPEMQNGLRSAGYKNVEKDLSPDSSEGPINLWYFKGNLLSDVPIMELDVTANPYDEAKKFSAGWERMAADLTRKFMGPRVYLWMRREVPIFVCQVEATDNFGGDATYFQNGFTRMDENTNKGAGGAQVFLWYLTTKDQREAIRDLQVSLSDQEYDYFQKKGYERVKVDLNKGSGAAQAYLWFKKENNNPIQTLSQIMDQASVDPYKNANVQVIEKNIAKTFEYLCFYR